MGTKTGSKSAQGEPFLLSLKRLARFSIDDGRIIGILNTRVLSLPNRLRPLG
jgi:hypothetical protein